MSEDRAQPDELVLYEYRTGLLSTVVQSVAVTFGHLCLLTFCGLVLHRVNQSLYVVVVAPAVLALLRDSIRRIRSRVVLRHGGIELRGLLTRFYPWPMIKSVDLEDGRIAVTPNGWVRRVPVTGDPRTAYDLIMDRRAEYLAGP